MTEAEEQLRAILREHAADSEHLLDEVLRETLEMALTTPSEAEAERILKEAGVDVGQLAADGRAIVATCIEEAEGHEARAERAERSLAALRQAVVRALESGKAAAEPMPIVAAPPTQQASGGWIEPWEFLPEPAPVPPTLTLDDVDTAVARVAKRAVENGTSAGDPKIAKAVGAGEVASECREILAQNGSGRG